jgi:hypothetical protein
LSRRLLFISRDAIEDAAEGKSKSASNADGGETSTARRGNLPGRRALVRTRRVGDKT